MTPEITSKVSITTGAQPIKLTLIGGLLSDHLHNQATKPSAVGSQGIAQYGQ